MNNADFEGAIQLLKRNPMLHLNTEDARVLLNNLETLTKDSKDDKVDESKVSSPSYLLFFDIGIYAAFPTNYNHS